MANNFFQFKQFIVHQDNCAMKVCTDACVLGAYVADNIEKKQLIAHSILDIGTGSGLLSLMLAQKTTDNIDAIEIDGLAYDRAKQNFAISPWKERLKVLHIDALQFRSGSKYDLIITNPPFYERDLLSVVERKNAAKHDTTLTWEELLKVINENLSKEGTAAILLPFHRLDYFETKAAKFHLFLSTKLLLKNTFTHPYFRGILFFTRKEITPVVNELILKNEDGKYTLGFIQLLKDYYLYL